MNTNRPSDSATALPRGLLWLMAVATGLSVASNYYAQPLLPTIATSFEAADTAVAGIVTTAQLSYGAGLLLLVPLADLRERRSLIVGLMLLASAGLLLSATATQLPMLLVGTAITGFCSVVAQVLVPFAATLSAPEHRGRAVGTVMSGLLIGILLARTVAGGFSSLLHWRAVYVVAAVLMMLCAVALRRALPRYRADAGIGYTGLLRSVIQLFFQERVLRVRALLGMISFALFSLFWTPLAFVLTAPPYGYSDAVIGLFGLAGAAGALAASWAGRLADQGKGATGVWLGLLGLLLAWLPLGYAQSSLVALLIGVLMLDLAVQLVHVSNQNAIYALDPNARNRLNAGYMTCYFIGGATGSWLAGYLYAHAGWPGIVATAVGIATLGIVVGLTGLKRPAPVEVPTGHH
ncbi:MFS transporter [Nitrogeniibacter aestuarii]|uniref:MFS transporter n=1 Tax=Nitrogeniibacter aestuarii TaxID=2815343 RepID=UPI001E30973E|nr:MFS transporter [Nitrogeniibacter aestuarii]